MIESEIFYVAGAGRFGRQAISKLLLRPRAQVFVVEKNPSTVGTLLAEIPLAEDQLIVDDAVGFLSSYIRQNGHDSAWIIPTIPLHLAAALVRQLTGRAYLEWDEIPLLPHGFLGPNGELYSSLADFICPEDCPQPPDHCYTTGEPREKSLVQILEEILYHDYPSLVLQSRQLAPGVGGFQVAAIRKLLEQINDISGPLVFSTACLCHGVSNLLGSKPS
jgi:hypothetical protein